MSKLTLGDSLKYHIRFYENEEKKKFDQARRLYRGDAWKGTDAPKGTVFRSMLASKNMIYAIADTAVSSLLGPNPKVTCRPRNQEAEHAKPAVNGLMDYIFDRNRLRSRAAVALVDSVLTGRGCFKTGWDKCADLPRIREVDPSKLFFDLDVRNVEDISYWAEITPLRKKEFAARVQSGKYTLPKGKNVEPSMYPRWLESAGDENRTRTRNAHGWVPIWEYYDVLSGMVYHYHLETGCVLMERPINYIPYSMFFLNHNGIDCRGLAEVQLVLDQQKTINELLTLLKQITYLQIPRILYDSGQIGSEDLNRIMSAATGAFIGVDPENSEALRNLGSLFYQMPVPQNPPDVAAFISMMADDMAFISALAEMARGQVAGARTATEMALVDQQQRTRLGTREGNLNAAIADTGRKAFYLARRRMTTAHAIRATGSVGWINVDHATLAHLEADFSVTAYNPIQRNPGVLAEALVNLTPLLAENPYVKQYEITKAVFDGLGLPESALRTEAEVEQAAAEAAAAEQEAMAAQMGAAGGMPPGAEGLPPEMAAAGGGVPGGAIPPEILEAAMAEGPAAMGAPVDAPSAIQDAVDPATGLPTGRPPTEEEILAALAAGAPANQQSVPITGPNPLG
jgi:hypothetical protein